VTGTEIERMRDAALVQLRIGLDAMVKLSAGLPPFSEAKQELVGEIDRLRTTIRRVEGL
jgi:hypothetical protein